jgi:predicted HicB family RNase H-like nuclease
MPQPHKGDRARLNLRVPVTLYAQIAALAARANTDVNSYVQAVLAAHVRDRSRG